MLDVLAVSKWRDSYSVDLGLAAMPLPDIYDGEGFVPADFEIVIDQTKLFLHGVVFRFGSLQLSKV